jgi:hypothetical protein
VEITTLPNVRFWFSKWFTGKMEFCAGQSTWRVRPWHRIGSEYLEGTADDLRWSCSIDNQSYLSKEFPPFLEILLNTYTILL